MIDRLLASMKAAETALPFDGGSLVPVGRLSESLVQVLYEGRAGAADTYPYRGKITLETTRRWATEKLIGDPGTIYFRVCDPRGALVGVLGYTDCLGDEGFQIYAVLRLNGAHRGLMGKALRAALAWAYDVAGTTRIWLVTRAANTKAIRFYGGAGFVSETLYPIIHDATGAYARLADGDPRSPTDFLLTMRHVREKA